MADKYSKSADNGPANGNCRRALATRGKNLPIRLKLIEEFGRIGLHARASTGIVLVELMRVEQPAIIRHAAWRAACAMRGCEEETAGRPLDSSG